MKSVTIHNPAAEFLAVYNKGGKGMTRKAKTNRGSASHNKSHNRAKKRNPARAKNRRHNRAHRNPAAKSILVGGMFAAAGSIATNVLAGFVPIHAEGWMGIAVKLGLAYATGMLAEKLGVSGINANYMAIGGFAGAAGEAISMVMGEAGGVFHSIVPQAPQAQVAAAPGVAGYLNDIAPFPDEINRYALGDVAPQPAWQ